MEIDTHTHTHTHTHSETNNGLRNDTAEVAGSTLMVDLQTHNELDLAVGVFYDVNVRAVNSEGIGPPSDSVEFRREASEWIVEFRSAAFTDRVLSQQTLATQGHSNVLYCTRFSLCFSQELFLGWRLLFQ